MDGFLLLLLLFYMCPPPSPQTILGVSILKFFMLYLNAKNCVVEREVNSIRNVTLRRTTLYRLIRGEEGDVGILAAEPSVRHRLVLTYSVKDVFFLLFDFLSRLQP